MARPDHGGVTRKERWQQTDRCVYILFSDVAENAANQKDVCGNDVFVRRRDGCVTRVHFDISLRDTVCSRSCVVDQVNILFNEMSSDVVSTVMAFKNSDDVPPLARAHTDDPDGAFRSGAQCLAKPSLDND